MKKFAQRALWVWQHIFRVFVHKWHVYRAGRILDVPLWRLIIHDWSKLLTRTERIGYSLSFFGPGKAYREVAKKANGTTHVSTSQPIPEDMQKQRDDMLPAVEEASAAFSKAWDSHLYWNDHHPEHWSRHKKDQRPSEAALRETVADWLGASRAYDGKYPESFASWVWWNTEQARQLRLMMHPDDAERCNKLLQAYFIIRSKEVQLVVTPKMEEAMMPRHEETVALNGKAKRLGAGNNSVY
jgi:hypothetical protein